MLFEKTKNLLERHIFWVLLLPTLLISPPMLFNLYKQSWGLQPPGPADWEIENIIWSSLLLWSLSILLFCIGYGVLYFRSRKALAILSLLQILLIGVYIGLPFVESRIHHLLLVSSWIVFTANLLLSKKSATS